MLKKIERNPGVLVYKKTLKSKYQKNYVLPNIHYFVKMFLGTLILFPICFPMGGPKYSKLSFIRGRIIRFGANPWSISSEEEVFYLESTKTADGLFCAKVNCTCAHQ